jgi:hypothetical protein
MPERPHRTTQLLSIAAVICLLGMALGAGAVGVNALGAGDRFDRLVARVDRFIAGPPPDRPTVATVDMTDPNDTGTEDEETTDEEATPEPTATPVPTTTPSSAPGVTPEPTPEPTATPTPAPERKRVDINIVKRPKKVFASQVDKDWCAPAGVQMALAVLGLVDTSDKTQTAIHSKVRKWESYKDSHNGDWGPAAMVLALKAYGAPGYEIHAYNTRQGALRGAARAIQKTGAPAILLAWRGAHTWVMTGFRATADPSVFDDAKITGTYVLDPWYPRISSIWGPSDPPGTFQNEAEMVRNFLKWKRPEGRYPDRDGKYIVVIPTVKASEL